MNNLESVGDPSLDRVKRTKERMFVLPLRLYDKTRLGDSEHLYRQSCLRK